MFEGVKSIISGFFDSKNSPDTNNNDPELLGDIEEQVWKDEVVSLVKRELERRKQERMIFELQWRLNMNFMSGNQYCDINEYTMSIMEQDKLYYWQQREIFNHIAPIVETRLAKLGRLRPTMTVRPATNEEEDMATAKVCKSIVDSTYRKINMKDKISNANAWCEVCGSVFYKSIWNPSAGRLIAYIDQDPLYEGDVDVYVTPAFEVFPDNVYNDGPEKCRSIIHAKAYTIEEIEEIWNRKVGGSTVDIYSMGMTSVGCGGLGYTATIPKVAPTTMDDAAIVMEYYEIPSRKYPKGRLIIVAQDELLYYGPLPYVNGEDKKRILPFVRQNCTDNAGCFFGKAIIERCIPIQRAYNAVKNRKHDFLNRAAVGVLTYEENTIDDEDLEIDGLAPGAVLARKQGSTPPSFIQNGNLPPEFREEEEKLKEEFRIISGVSEMESASQVPTGAGSGVSLEILKEQSDTRISLTANNIRDAIILIAKQWLRLYKQFATGPRMDRLVGKNNQVFISEWCNNDITSDDVVNETEDDLAQTPAQRKQNVINMLQLGLFNDPDSGRLTRETRAKIFDMMNFGNWEDGDNIDQLHITRAMKENLDIQKSTPITVRDFDDDEIHIEQHNKFRLTGDYVQLQNDRPDLAKIFDFHVQLHQQSLGMKQQLQMQQAAMAQPQLPNKVNNSK